MFSILAVVPVILQQCRLMSTTCLTKCMVVQVSVDVPDQKGRLEILKVHARNKKLNEDVDLKEVASRVPGFTGADLANLLNEVRHMFNQILIVRV